MRTFCNVLTNIEWYYRTNDINYLQDYPFNLIMGEMAPAYEQFTQAVRTCVMYQEFDLYPQKKKFLDDELKILNESKQANALEILKVKREAISRFYQAISRLPEQQREILLQSANGKKIRDIALSLGISENTVKTQKKRAYFFLREQLGELWLFVLPLLFK